MITVDEIMTTELQTLKEGDSVSDARALMTTHHIRHVPIVDGRNHLVGLVSQRDVLAAAESTLAATHRQQQTAAESAIPVHKIMTRDVQTIEESTDIRQAAISMQSHKYGCLPVVAGGRLIGLVTDSDFVEVAINLLEQLEEQTPEDDTEEPEYLEKPGSLLEEMVGQDGDRTAVEDL